MGEPRIVAAALTATVSGDIGRQSGLAEAIGQAMSQAVTDALAAGVSIEDTRTLLARKLAAKDGVIASFKEAQKRTTSEG